MSWKYQQAQTRIRKLIEEAPSIEVQNFYDDYMPLYESNRAAMASVGGKQSPPLFDLPKGRAVVVDTVQIYVNIVNYNDIKLDDGQETEASHARALKFLHLHYSACDRVMQSCIAQRVDFHDGRMHAVVIDSTGNGVTSETLAEAFAFIRDFQIVANQANEQLANSEFTARFRIGVDVGKCVAINNGTGVEQEPMFLGSSANHAAKLADGEQAGIFVSDRVRSQLNMPELGGMETYTELDQPNFGRVIASRNPALTMAFGMEGITTNTDNLLLEWRNEITALQVENPTNPNFVFHYKEPPLKDIQFKELIPSSSIRMPLASIFADLSGFTNYIDRAIATGEISEAVTALYVLRGEFQNVVHDDFGGRKIRFIGDCIHALIAEGNKQNTDPKSTLVKAAACAGGLRSSFELCQNELHSTQELGLAIGIEYGETPVSRIGIRGDRSVRVASSLATTTSELVQKDCGHNETKFGSNARLLLPTSVQDLLNEEGIANEMSYDDVATGSLAAPAIAQDAPFARAHTPEKPFTPRAHFEI
jgi:class 3 adenylate cyclase